MKTANQEARVLEILKENDRRELDLINQLVELGGKFDSNLDWNVAEGDDWKQFREDNNWNLVDSIIGTSSVKFEDGSWVSFGYQKKPVLFRSCTQKEIKLSSTPTFTEVQNVLANVGNLERYAVILEMIDEYNVFFEGGE